MPFVEPVTKKGAEMTERNNQRVIFHVTKEKRRKIWEGKTSGPTFIFCSQDHHDNIHKQRKTICNDYWVIFFQGAIQNP